MTAVTHWGRWPHSFGRRQALPWPEQLLIIGPPGLGDTVTSLPALRQIRHESPRTRVHWIAPSTFEPVLRLAGVDAFIALESSPQPPLDLRIFGALLTLQDIDAATCAHLGALAEITHRIGSANGLLQQKWCNHLVHVKRFGLPRHEAQRHFQLLMPFGVDVDLPLRALTQRVGLPAPRLAVIADLPSAHYQVFHAFSHGHGREWPVAHWIELARLLTGAGWQVVMTGSAAEGSRLADAWPATARPTGMFDACGRLDLAQLASLLSRAAAVVAASTGPLHLAAALGVASVGLFAPRKGIDMSRWAPLGARAVGIQARARCAQRCDASTCRCIQKLLPQRVADAVASAIASGTLDGCT